MKKIIKDIRGRFSKLLKELEEVSNDSRIKHIDLSDGAYKESASSLILSFIPRGELLLKRLDAIISKLPKEPRRTQKVEVKDKPKKLSQRLLRLSKLINPQEIEVVWSSGKKQKNSRDELAKILWEVRKLERK